MLHVIAQQGHQLIDHFPEVVRHVLFQAADAEVVVHQARAGHCLKEGLDSLATPEGEHHRRHGSGVQAHGANIEQMAGDAVQLAEDDADVFGAFGHFQAHELFNGHAVGQLIVEVADVVHTVEEGYDLVVLFTLAKLFGAAVQIADVRFHVHDFLAVHPQHHAKDAMGGWMLRAHVEQHLNGLGIGPDFGSRAGC